VRVVAFRFRGDPAIGSVVVEVEHEEIETTPVREHSMNGHAVEGRELVV
jgi:hypothetical protein